MPSSRFAYLQAGIRYVTADGQFSQGFRVYWQQFIDALDGNFTDIETALNRINASLNLDGTVKPNLVITSSVAAEAITAPVFFALNDATIPATGAEITVGTTGTETVGDATYGGALVTMQGDWNNSADGDAGAEIYLETNSNSVGWARHSNATFPVGSRTSGGTTFAFIPFNKSYPIAAAGLTTLAARIVAKGLLMPSAPGIRASALTNPALIISPLKR